MAQKTVLVSGANKGIGFEICRQLGKKGWRVILTSRDESKGKAAAELLQKENVSVHYVKLDVSSPESIENLKRWMETHYPNGLDVLINNAALFLPADRADSSSVLTLEKNTLD